MAAGRPILHVAAAALLAVGVLDTAASATTHKTHRAPPTPALHDVAPDTTATIAAKSAQRPADPAADAQKADDESLPAPFHLPSASRARMRDCGRKWQAMKMSGEAGDDIWRDFATRCLAAADGPFEARSR